MTVETSAGSATVATEVPKGWWKRRRHPLQNPPPVVIEIRIDVNRNDAEEADKGNAPSAVVPVAEAIEKVATGNADPEEHDWPPLIGQIGNAVRDRMEGIVGTAGDLVENRVEELINSANSQIDRLVENTVSEAMDIVIQNVLEKRLSRMLGVTIDLTQLEKEQDEPSVGEAARGIASQSVGGTSA